jgi:hypothetical protein
MQTNIGGKDGDKEALKGIAHWGDNDCHHKLQLSEQISPSWLWHGDLSGYSALV